ncbi:hypothetical protein F8E02_12540 [Methanoculleus sp. Wushi-C6]|uniref:PD-(D/E)XK nuclease superfamily protein n=1 Tax=Methanoculleus caldifontis TaxID=2651577 RepID=A0ABU3X417_9EURY|nr:hypothetical protein [Methanoculleus sp. Wushi-C6]MDV2482801.1 hypothetical protein [Methanoculleus sp. Wushi-C6]
MALAAGNTVYSLVCSRVTGCGLSLNNGELELAINGPVAALLRDDEGYADIAELITSIDETGFDRQEALRTLERTGEPEPWRIGEALAECYLVEHRDCFFPWPDGRDERKWGSSLPGADLVGFQVDNNGCRFAFGEVKTSGEEEYPPGIMYGRSGLKGQIEDLKNDIEVKSALIRYLTHRAVNSSWKSEFQQAFTRYMTSDKFDFSIFGVLVRDVTAHIDDLRTRVDKLGVDCSTPLTIELLAIYLPQKVIGSWEEKCPICLARECET